MTAKKILVVIVAAGVGLFVVAMAVDQLGNPERTTVDPIEIQPVDDEAGPDRPRHRRQPKAEDTPVRRDPSRGRTGSGADPASAPPAPAGDDDQEEDEDDDDASDD